MKYQRELEKEKIKIGKTLRKYREEVGFTSAFHVSSEIGTGYDAIFKIEKGLHLPTTKIVEKLVKAYKLNETEIKDFEEVVANARVLRRKAREQNANK